MLETCAWCGQEQESLILGCSKCGGPKDKKDSVNTSSTRRTVSKEVDALYDEILFETDRLELKNTGLLGLQKMWVKVGKETSRRSVVIDPNSGLRVLIAGAVKYPVPDGTTLIKGDDPCFHRLARTGEGIFGMLGAKLSELDKTGYIVEERIEHNDPRYDRAKNYLFP